MSEGDIEREIQAKGLTAARLTPQQIDATIAAEQYHVFEGTTLTVCVLTLRNGFTVTGESAAVSPANFDEELGRKIARGHARDKIWQLEGYLLRELIFRSGPNALTNETPNPRP
ncbi:MAG TPA: Gp49 family protein [Gammaproteobacteria bacterium]|nr:Gp49 family protein [Gammaproteobacteria bacterium]